MTSMKKHLLILLTIILALSAGACGRRVVATGWSGLTTADETLYLSAGASVHAVNPRDGSLKWQFPEEPQRGVEFYAAPVLREGEQLIVGGYDSVLYSINPDSGVQQWTFNGAEDRYIASPLVTEQGIFAPSADQRLYAVDFDGSQLWEPFETEEPIWASPVYSDACSCLYLVSMDRYLYAIDPSDGTLLWKSDELGGPMVSKPALSGEGLIYVSTFGNQILALSEEDAAIIWSFETEDWAWASPVIDGDQVYASDISGTLYALDAQSGELNWQVQPGGAIVSSPLVREEEIIFSTTEGSLVMVSKTGTIQRNQEVEGKLYSSPAAAADLLLVTPAEADQILIALDENGNTVWDYPPAE